MLLFSLETLFSDFTRGKALAATARARRLKVDDHPRSATLLFDDCDEPQATCLFLRVPLEAGAKIGIRVPGNYRLISSRSGGWVFRSNEGASYWIPCLPLVRRLGAQGHILSEAEATLDGFDLGVDGLVATFSGPDGVMDMACWQLRAPDLPDQLACLSALEPQHWFLWGSHTRYAQPASIYLHLIHGQVYERNYAWPHRRKIYSENDAHALYVTLSGLERATGKTLYRLLKSQLLLSVLGRQGKDGGFRHGEWTGRMESHYRLHVSAMHLMMDSLAENPDDMVVRGALTRAADFVAARTDQLTVGTWFLHDELEEDTAAMDAAPFRWVSSRALGKRESNMLVLNTHLDTSVALDRYAGITGDDRHAAAVASAQEATRAVLALRPAETLYRLIFRVVTLTLLPTRRAAALPVWLRMLKRLGWKYLLPQLPDIKTRIPRLVMPGGYVDRELSLRTWAHHYLSINLMDLARHQRRMPSDEVAEVIRNAAAYAHDSGILQRWAELKYEKYALGFWAEALYHLCLLVPQADEYRTWLAEAVLLLEDTGQGLPPSLLGANAEAVPPAEQLPCPLPTDGRLRVINLGRRGRPELLAVNPGKEALPLAWYGTAPAVAWQTLEGRPAEDGLIPARGGLWGRAA